ncbi:hypothetical protein [Rhodohalobacter sulfatireducens]|uniref:Transporter n=1 Tax=Rhodohalobacter sulfatireducens TaxID=2911366 RepID=A0ABS9KDA5_9BACT|nr:hypothetical protein [Rhodohalobacter sulfatireducens]MCG2588835.1 hypothetical protein [Rhodohalobacter sulfatireducens]
MEIQRRNRRIFTVALLGVTLVVGCVQAQQVSYHGNVQYATGSYFFDESTSSFSASNGLGYVGDKFSVSFSVPFIVQNSPWISYSAAGQLPTGGPQHGGLADSTGRRPGKGGKNGNGSKNQYGSGSYSTPILVAESEEVPITLPDTTSYTQSSFGDPNIYASLKLYSSGSGSSNIQLNSGFKIPFADPNNGFGTGEWDYGVGISLSQRFGKFFMYTNFMRWWLGNMPDLELKDPLTYSAGLTRTFGQGKWFINSTFSGYTEIIKDYDPPMNLSFGVGLFASNRISLNSTFTLGLSESSADQVFGIGWSLKL